MTQNSALSQNWVKCIGCTPRDPGCARITPRPLTRCALGAVAWRTGRHVVAPLWSCRRCVLPCRCEHARAGEPYRSSPLSRYKNRIAKQNPFHEHNVVSQRELAVSQALSRAASSPLGHDTKIVSRPKPLPSLSQLPTPYRGALLRCLATQCRCPLSRYETSYRDTPR